MKFKFKIQQYQTDAVENTVAVFHGQPSHEITEYRRDLGKKRDGTIVYAEEYSGYRNSDVELSAVQLLDNIRTIQSYSDIPQSDKLADGLGVCNLDIEMETGTGKTYVYIKTMFELNRNYGWSKFVIVVPSIAIREGVAKSFSMLEDHFMEYYGKKARYFIYDSGNLQQLDGFSSDAGINVMIINTQAFAASLKEGGRSKDSRIIYSKQDNFGSRRPIDVIAANRPILIMDEPQKMGGNVTQTSLKKFNPLFTLYYSATHKVHHDTIYALDALDAYKQKLVKKIQVKGFEVKNLRGSSGYLYLDSFILSKNAAPMVKIDLEISRAGGIRRESHRFKTGDNLYTESNLHEYDGYTISEINPYNNSVTFLNGLILHKGEVVGDSSELTMQRVQIRETISSHFEKERTLFEHGIKTLSLFFVDKVANYKSYDENGEEIKGVLCKIFEEEYNNILNEKISLFDDEYQAYLRRFNASEVHKGYFSIDKRGHAVDSKVKRGEDTSDDISAYSLIIEKKERLLSFDEPVRFIFSHSALREGWDNPNIFQICTLRHANSSITKRQEVGRGLRLCVDQQGNRMDYETLGENVQDVNKLTVVANESYTEFVDKLQKETIEDLRERPAKADESYFEGKVLDVNGERHSITKPEASAIYTYLWENEYVDDGGRVTDNYKKAVKDNAFLPLSAKLQPMTEGIHKLVQSIFDSDVNIDDMIENGHETPVDNQLNENFKKAEFRELWNNINHKYIYTVHYNSSELIGKAIDNINNNLYVTELKYIMVTGTQESADAFGDMNSTTKKLGTVCTSTVKYDLVGEISRGATLTRRTVVEILKGIRKPKLDMFKNNPEEFIHKVIRLIKEQKATMIVEHIGYSKSDETYDSSIFTKDKHSQSIEKAYPAKKSILNYIFTDGLAEESTERKFAESLDGASEVSVYAKLPRSFQIPTPVGNYAPDWAIAFKKGTVKHIFFIAETKGSLDSMELRGVEKAKIECAKKLFNETSSGKVKYWNVTSYEDLLDVMEKI